MTETPTNNPDANGPDAEGQVPADVNMDDTTGHVWDGIAELNTPLPKWWLYILYASIIWAFGYWIVMPTWPFPSSDGGGFTKGIAGYSQRDTVAREIAESEATRAVFEVRIAAASLSDIRTDEKLLSVALAGGAAAFGDNCAPCHGSGAQGFTGFPNLNDDDWLWGGSLEEIYQTVAHGIRWDEDDDTRYSQMPKFLIDELLEEAEISQVVNFVLSLSGSQHDAAKAAAGATLYEDQCSFCHGQNGEGDQEQGAPNLADALWLYGSDEEALIQSVSYARYGVMPAWSGRLKDATVKELALYVHSLGGGE
jgi:cytochrome c oxidase cbb3-type subunit III